MKNGTSIFAIALAATAAFTTAAEAHTGAGAGFVHPFTGIDHILAIVAVGLWAGLSRGKVGRVAPVAFVVAMAAGALMAVSGVALPGIEAGIAASVVVFGLLAFAVLRLSPAVAGALVSAFALFHGAAHGAEIGTAALATYMAGFIAATVILLAGGMSAAALLQRAKAEMVVRIAGGATAAAGMALALS